MNIYNRSDIPDDLIKYFHPVEIGLEDTPEEYINTLVEIFREVSRILKDDGTLWVNIGDTYNNASYKKDEKSNGKGKQGTNKGSYANVVERPRDTNTKVKDLIGIPWLLAFALRNDGWYLRQDIIWSSVNKMPEPVQDRCTRSHEYIFLLSKKSRYYFDYESIQEQAVSESAEESGMRNKRDVWNIPISSYKGSHFATFPKALVEPMVFAGSRVGGTVLDIFNGSGTTGIVATQYGRNYVGIELNPDYAKLTQNRVLTESPNVDFRIIGEEKEEEPFDMFRKGGR